MNDELVLVAVRCLECDLELRSPTVIPASELNGYYESKASTHAQRHGEKTSIGRPVVVIDLGRVVASYYPTAPSKAQRVS